MADFPSTYGYTGLIRPSDLPIRSFHLDATRLDEAATSLERMGTVLADQVGSAHEDWATLPTHYEAPEAEDFYRLLDRPLSHATLFDSRMGSAATALRDLADVITRERPRLLDLESDALTFYDEVSGGVETTQSVTAATLAGVYTHTSVVTVEWHEHQASWERNTELWERYFEIHTALQTADESAAGTILALRTVDERLPGQPGGPELEAPAGAPTPPWGDVDHGGQAEMIMGQIFLEQFGPLVGYNAFTGEFDGSLAREAWSGVWNGVVDVATLRGVDVGLFVAQQIAARTSGGYVEYDPDNQAHRVFDGLASGLTIDLFSDDPLSQWDEDPHAAAATLQFLGISVLAGGPLAAGARVTLGPLARTLVQRGSVVVGNVRFTLGNAGITLTNLVDGSWRRPSFGPDGQTAVQHLLRQYEQEHGRLPDDPPNPPGQPDGGGSTGGGAAPTPGVRVHEPFPGTQVLLPDGDRAPNLVSQTQAPTRYTDADVAAAWEGAYRNPDGVRVDPRTGAPLVGDAPGTGSRRWVMYWDDVNGRWVAGNRGEGWGATSSRYPADTFDVDRGDGYASGDGTRPGDHPPGQVPPATTTAGSGETGHVHLARGERGMDYQLQISGYQRTPDGLVPEYQYADPDTGRTVTFDGHTYRGEPPTEVFLEAKDGYGVLAYRPDSSIAQGVSRNLLAEVRAQLRVLPDGAVLEWHVSDPVGASAIRRLLERNGFDDVAVTYTPSS